MKKPIATPTLKLDGTIYKAPKPKMRLLRKCMKFNSVGGNIQTEEGYDMILDLICDTFRDQGVTPEVLEEKMDMDDLMPVVTDIVNWIGVKLNANIAESPNSQAPAEK